MADDCSISLDCRQIQMMSITIATSIAPRNFELQRAAIDSWLALGITVISCNSASEAEVIAPHFPDIHIYVVNRTAEQSAGRPYVFFDDVCAALADSGSPVCGIINSDVQLRANRDFVDSIVQAAAGSFLFGSRMDLRETGSSIGERYLWGFDFFFFDRAVIGCYPRSEFCLGVPWWDYWAPMVPLMGGIPCKEIVTPVAFHLWHETKWAPELFDSFGAKLATCMQTMTASTDAGHLLREKAAQVLVSGEFSPFSISVLLFILNGADQVNLAEGEPLSVAELVALRRQVLERASDLLALQTELASIKRIETAAVAEEEPRNSLYWCITRKLRWCGDLVRKLTN